MMGVWVAVGSAVAVTVHVGDAVNVGITVTVDVLEAITVGLGVADSGKLVDVSVGLCMTPHGTPFVG